jgi:hypothetical protein
MGLNDAPIPGRVEGDSLTSSLSSIAKSVVNRVASPPTRSPTSSPAAPTGHTFRRAATSFEDAAGHSSNVRRRFGPNGNGAADDFAPPRRRSSNFSDYSLNEARRTLSALGTDGLLNPGADAHAAHGKEGGDGGSGWASLPLVFALLPAVAGMFFKNGSAIITDVMLLALAAIFLQWSVTQPWAWYHSAQEVRKQEESDFNAVVDDELDSDTEKSPSATNNGTKATTLEDVPEDGETPSAPQATQATRPKTPTPPDANKILAKEAATNELYRHEVLALFACFAFPMAAAYLLHAIRGQLSRPSEGLVSDYNLIFLLASEIRPLRHMIKLVKSRTLFLQRTVHENTHLASPPANSGRIADLMARLEQLESHQATQQIAANGSGNGEAAATTKGKGPAPDPQLIREVRNAIQPELDALNRAVRRYEKKATVLAFQTESRLGAIDLRLNDAITLAAAAAKNSSSGGSVLGWLAERIVWLVTLPMQALATLITLPVKAVTNLVWRGKKAASGQDRGQRSGKGWRGGAGQMRLGGDRLERVPTRVAKR